MIRSERSVIERFWALDSEFVHQLQKRSNLMEPIFWKKLETNIKAQVLRRFQRIKDDI